MQPRSVFGLDVRQGEAYDFVGLPMLYRSAYEGTRSTIGDTRCVIVRPKGQLRPLQAEKLCRLIWERESLPCLVYAEGATAYQRSAMTERGVAWASSENTFSIPFLAASCDERELRRGKAKPLSAGAQRVAVGAMGGWLMGMTTTEVAGELGVSLSSVANYFSELDAACQGLVGARGRTRFLRLPECMTGEMVYEALRPYMSSPVRERIFLRVAADDARALDSLPLSGVSALSLRTEIADDPWQIRALFGRKADELFPSSQVVGEHDQPDAMVEVWRYEPWGRDGVVDAVSLLLDLEGWQQEGDERLEEAVETLRRDVFS